MEGNSIELLKSRLLNAAEIQLLPAETKKEIGKLYEILAYAAINNNPDDGVEIERCKNIVNDNKLLFEILLNPIFYALVKSAPSQFFKDADMVKLSQVDKKKNYVYHLFVSLNNFKGYTSSALGLKYTDNFATATLPNLVMMATTPEAEYSDDDEIITDKDLEGVQFDNPDEVDMGTGEDEPSEQTENTTPENPEDELNPEDLSLKEYSKQVEKIFDKVITSQVSELVAVLDALYGSGFTSLGQFGLLINNEGSSPIVKLTSTDGSYDIRKYEDGSAGTDYDILNILIKRFPEFKCKATPADCIADEKAMQTGINKESVPKAQFFMDNNAVCYRLHSQWQNANVQFATGLISIRKYLTETYGNASTWLKENNGGAVTLKSYKEVKKWYAWSIRRIIMRTLKDLNFVPTFENSNQLKHIVAQVSKNLRNVIVINERDDKGVREEFRLSTESTIDKETLQALLESGLNIGSSNSTIVKDIKYNHNVIAFTIVYDQEKENETNLFAADIVDRMLESGNKPSWSHALLGKDLDKGGYFFWDGFMDPKKAAPADRCYTIYAASRSGKGVMTSTLVASALCDGKQVFYTDGKPENGAALGEIAWKSGREAYVFNGTARGEEPYAGEMELHSHDVRKPSEVADYINKLPKCLFENDQYFDNDKQADFLALMRYLKSLTLCATTIANRSSGDLPSDNWQVWIFDEVTNLSKQEKEIRNIFYRYLSTKGVKVVAPKDSEGKFYFTGFKSEADVQQYITEGGEKYDAGVAYIYKWNMWLQTITTIISKAAVISLGKASMNIIFIFQEPSWIATDGDITCICRIIKSLKSTKIAGRGAIPRQAGQAAGEYGDATMRQDWINEIDGGGGKWVISHGSNIKQASVSKFRPYNVYTKYLGKGENKPLQYLDGYVTHLLSKFNMDPGEIIESSYLYADNAVKTLGLAGSLKEFMYDCTNFANVPVNSQYSELVEALENSETADGSGSPAFANDILENGQSAPQPATQGTQPGATQPTPPDPRKQMSANLNMLPFKSAQQFSGDDAVINRLRERINREFSQTTPKFNLFNRNKEQYGLMHLCWNLSIWAYLLNIGSIPGNTEPSIALFCQRYMDLIASRQAMPDFIPTSEMVEAMIRTTPDGQQAVQQAVQSGETLNPANYQASNDTASEMADGMYVNVETPSTTPQHTQMPNGQNLINTQAPQTRLTQIIELTDFNSIELTQPYSGSWLERMLTHTEKGRSQIFSNGIKAVIGAIDKKIPDRAAVTRIKAHEDNLIVNGMYVNLTPMFVNNEYGLRFQDVVNVKVLLDNYRRVEELDLDTTMFDQVIIDYGDTAQDLWTIFQQNQRLRVLKAQIEPNGAVKVYTRQDFAQQAADIQTAAKKRKNKLQVEAVANINNPRLSEAGIGVVSGSYKVAQGLGNQFVKKMTQDNPQIFRGIGYGLLASVALGFGAVGTGIGAIGRAFKRGRK